MRYNTCILARGAPCLLLLSAVGGASAFGLLLGNNGRGGGGGGGGGSFPHVLPAPTGIGLGCKFLSSARRARWPKPRITNRICDASKAYVCCCRSATSGHVLCSTSSSDDDEDSSSSTPRNRRKVSDEEMEERKEQLRILLCASEKDIDKLVRNSPTVLERRDIVESHGPKVTLLQERLGISQKAAGKLCLQANRLLMVSLATLEGKLDWLVSRLKTNRAQLRNIIEQQPDILTLSIEENIRPSLKNIQSLLELSDKELTKMVVRAPDVLRQNFSVKKLATRLLFLQQVLCIEMNDKTSLRAAILKRPELLHWSEKSMLGVQNWLRYRIGLGGATIAKRMKNRPEFMTSNISTLEEKANWIQSEFSLSDDELSDLLGKSDLLLYSEEKLKAMRRCLRLTFNVDDEGLKDLVMRQPALFKSSIKDIEGKLHFYSALVGEKEAKRLVIKSSNLLVSASLEKRLKPRLSQIRNAGRKVVWTEQLIQRLARRSDDLWERYGLGDARRGGPLSSN